MEDWHVQLNEEPGRLGYNVFIFRVTGSGKREFVTKGGKEIQQITIGYDVKKDITFAFLEHDQLKALADAFSKKGFKTDNDHKIEGLLEATKYHLEDMRALALKKGKR